MLTDFICFLLATGGWRTARAERHRHRELCLSPATTAAVDVGDRRSRESLCVVVIVCRILFACCPSLIRDDAAQYGRCACVLLVLVAWWFSLLADRRAVLEDTGRVSFLVSYTQTHNGSHTSTFGRVSVCVSAASTAASESDPCNHEQQHLHSVCSRTCSNRIGKHRI